MIKEILNNIDSANHKFDNSQFKEWAATPATTKGKIGEDIAAEILMDLGHVVTQRVSKEHDMVVDGKKVEVKTAFLKKDSDTFSFYGYDATEDPHYWLYQFVYPQEIVMVAMTRKDMADIYLGKTRKNQMMTVTMEQMVDAGGMVMGSWSE